MLFEPGHPRLAQAISRAGGDLLVGKSRWDQRRGSSGLCPYDVAAVFALSPTFWATGAVRLGRGRPRGRHSAPH
jgi:hypothetical protein